MAMGMVLDNCVPMTEGKNFSFTIRANGQPKYRSTWDSFYCKRRREASTTGISAYERALTVKIHSDPASKPNILRLRAIFSAASAERAGYWSVQTYRMCG
jgi:3,4-dihydroxy-2-butanone 4-phosphate synthase